MIGLDDDWQDEPPVPNFDERTEVANLPAPCAEYDYVGDHSWCRRCGWAPGFHADFVADAPVATC